MPDHTPQATTVPVPQCQHIFNHWITDEQRAKVVEALEYARHVHDAQGIEVALVRLTQPCSFRDQYEVDLTAAKVRGSSEVAGIVTKMRQTAATIACVTGSVAGVCRRDDPPHGLLYVRVEAAEARRIRDAAIDASPELRGALEQARRGDPR
jgi:hypothetical protein